jgi:hypothetical protein
MRAGLNLRDKKCNNCGKVFPENTNICDNCGSVSFSFLELKKDFKIKTIPSSKELIEQEKRIQQVKDAKHLCDDCEFEFSSCKSKKIVFGIDIENTLVGAYADKVVECKKYKQQEVRDLVEEEISEKEQEFFKENSEK